MLKYSYVLMALVVLTTTGCEPTNRGYAPHQPIVYSHAVHAGVLQVPCQYCHYAAERGRHAGIPPAAVCMNCHEQVVKDHPEVVKVRQAIANQRPIAWVRVHQLPDHAYFDHSAHAAGGVACQDCHGPIESMGVVRQESSLTMGWCVDCHRQRGANEVASLVATVSASSPSAARPERANRLTDCAVCHH